MADKCTHIFISHGYHHYFSSNLFNYETLKSYLVVLTLIANVVSINCDKVYTNQFAVHLNTDHTKNGDLMANDIANKYGFINDGQIGTLDGYYLFRHNRVEKRSADYSHKHHHMLRSDHSVLWVEQQHIKKRVKRDNLNSDYRYASNPMPDPLYKEMWYLNKGAVGGYDMNVADAWAMGYTGKGVVVTILDDGIQPNHPELEANYDPQASYDINDNDADPTPQDNGDNKHGTRCAGEVAAQAYNEYCGVGIAFNASIGGVRMLDGTVTDEVEARALSLNPNHIDIYSASWGPEDDGKTVDGPGRLAQRAFIDGIRKGRRGLGSVFIWASGNGGRRLDNCNCDGYTNSIYTLSISSATQNGAKPWYLEECSSTLATTYSSGTPGRDENVLTCDQDTTYFKSLQKGQTPNTSKLCTKSHTGTSASAPIAAAIVALALEANPTLTWRDLQHLVVLSSIYEPLRHENGWITNAIGRKVSHKFGYGLIDAHAMVRHAENWTPMPIQRICETRVDEVVREIPVHLKRQLEVTMSTDACRETSNEINYLEHVQAKITLKYRPRGNLKISLVSPSGTVSHLLFPRPRDADESTFNNWPFLSVHYWGEPAFGTWKMSVQNDGTRSARSPGNLMSWSLVFFGTYEKPATYHLSLNETVRYLPRSAYQTQLKLSECAKKGLIEQLDSNECGKSCASGQWINYQTGMCQKCSAQCKTCFGSASDNCLSCDDPNLFFGYQCIKQCSDGYYSDVSLKECLPCSSVCKTCLLSSDHCITCKSSLVLNNNTCVSSCQMKNSSNCLKCHESCDTCSGVENNQCLSCRKGFRLINGTCVDTQCPLNYFEHQTEKGMECIECHKTCKSCSGPSHTQCLSCFDNSTLTSDGLCYTCLSGQYMNATTKQCLSCHLTCSSCIGPTANECLSCEAPLSLYEKQCIPCCTDNINDINGLPVNMNDCCHCSTSNGQCSNLIATNRLRSIAIDNDIAMKNSFKSETVMNFFISNPFFIIALICVSAVIIFVVIFSALQIITPNSSITNLKPRPKNLHEYRKISTDGSNLDKNSEDLNLTINDDETDDESNLFEKT